MLDKRFIHVMWDDSLEGMQGYFADSICDLEKFVAEKDKAHYGTIGKSNSIKYPLSCDDESAWMFVYYEPHYDVRIAFENGKAVQYFNADKNKWIDTLYPDWGDNNWYRVKPEESAEFSIKDEVRTSDGSVGIITGYCADCYKKKQYFVVGKWWEAHELTKL